MLVIHPGVSIPETEFRFTYSRSGGPGGQNVNKVNSKATLHWNVVESPSLPVGVKGRFLARFKNRIRGDGALVLTSQRFRDQPKNAKDCLEKLESMLRETLTPPKRRRPTAPTRGSRERRIEAKKHRSRTKDTRRSRDFRDG